MGSGEVLAVGHGFGPVGEYIDVGQCKFSGYLAEEGGLPVIRFDEREVNMRGPELQGKGGESGAGSDVENARSGVASTRYPVPGGTPNIPAQTELGRGTLGSWDGPRVWRDLGEEVTGEEEGLAEVAGYDFFGVADGGEVDAGVPAE